MYKKFLVLALVLALSGLASALQLNNNAPGGASPKYGNWENPLYWGDGSRIPAATDATTQIYRSDGQGSKMVILNPVEGGIKPQMKYGTAILLIANGGALIADGSLEQTQGTSSQITVAKGGLLDVAKKVTQTTGEYKMASTGSSIDVLDIYGTVKVKGSLATSKITVGNTTATTGGSATVIIRAGGLLDVDAYAIGTGTGTQADYIKIYKNGVMKIKGNATSQVAADIAAGRMVGMNSGLSAYYVSAEDTTYVVPEPATVALLGLGGLLLFRRR